MSVQFFVRYFGVSVVSLMLYLYLCFTQICFVNLDPQKKNCQDDENKKVSQFLAHLLSPSLVIFLLSSLPTLHHSDTVLCYSYKNLSSVAMASRSLPKIRGFIC